MLLGMFGGLAGSEGAAIEGSQGVAIGTRSHFSHWSEQQKRTDAASVVAAGLAGALGAPIAATFIALEMGLGGRIMNVLASAMASFALVQGLDLWLGLPDYDFGTAVSGVSLAQFTSFRELGAIIVSGVFGAIVGVLVPAFIHLSHDSFQGLFKGREVPRVVVGGILLCLLIAAYPEASTYPYLMVGAISGEQYSLFSVLLLLTAKILSLALVLVVFGAAGIFTPLFVIGIIAGSLGGFFFPGVSGLGIFTGLSALFAVALGMPIAGAILVYEQTLNEGVLFAGLVGTLIGGFIRSHFNLSSLIEKDSKRAGLHLLSGRSKEVLDSVTVAEAMVTDHEVVYQNETVDQLYSALMKSDVPFLPVVDLHTKYIGLLSADVIEQAWRSQIEEGGEAHAKTPLSKLLEAKDLLYRSKEEVPSVHADQKLSEVVGFLQASPVLVVVNDQHRLLGLLFDFGIRIVYDQEVARRSLFARWRR